MPLRKINQRTFYKRLYSGQLKTITLLKRNVDLQQGTVTTYTMYGVRRSRITKTGETIQADMTSNHRTVWHIPRTEMDRLGLTDINALDRIVEQSIYPTETRWWQPESTVTIDIKLFEDMITIACVRIDPPNAATLAGS
jgi:hypothetical protein